MDNRIKVILFALLGLILAAFLAGQVGDGNYLPAIAVSAMSLILGVVLFIFPRVSFDASILTLSIAGVMIAGKGYSYIGVGGILFITEIVLFCALVGYFVRIIFSRASILPRTPMALPILLLICYMVFHLLFDTRQYGIMALRDASVIYYTGFFLAAYLFAKQEAWRHQLKVVILLTVPAAMLLMLVSRFNPELINAAIEFCTIGNRPFFFPHVDAADHVFLGVVLFFYQSALRTNRTSWPYYVGIVLVLLFVTISSRGTLYVSMFMMIGFLLYSGQIRFFLALLLPAMFSLGLLLAVYTYSEDFRDLPTVQRIEEELKSFEVLQNKNTEGAGADTANWRLDWWGWIHETVNRTNPAYGLGLGADLYIGFAREVLGQEIIADQAATRGAHSALFTILGRLGYIGAALFLWVVAIQIWYFHKAAVMWRRLGSKLDPFFLYLQGSLMVFFCTTFLQYTWEGPYSALPFWVFSGVSCYLVDQYYRGRIEPEWSNVKVVPDLLPEAETVGLKMPVKH